MPAFDAGRMLRPGQRATIADDRLAHHIIDVLRVRKGGTLLLFHEGIIYDTIVEDSSRESLTVMVTAQRNAPLVDRPIALVQAVIRPALLDDVVRMCVPLSVDRIVVYRADRSQPWNIAGRMERLQQIAQSAAEQAETGRVPALTSTEGLAPALKSLSHAYRVLHLSTGGHTTIGSLVGEGAASLTGPAAVVIGPEGGLTQREEAILAEAEATTVRLNTCILRSELAGFAAVLSIRELQGIQ